ncbi:HPr family phosphocarrier protein [Desulfobacter postgatei]|jgi:phosphotransferase system HPr-like phosphotransfer protein|uniref:HPr-related phosphotransferase system component n=1 Tax=Desulfobacter postgatei 2ac9 TaxID=879212 RepID=I5B6D0_9BACT|nr:HPr family phosphocarrier protein [Desulfobacter postgatei]EIM65043.1 HPr-related phosphotransferase system component [Desulfobacter postgatei 2ac9]MDX9964420.1 HPr family phosphocarrier protein [Desulfobacter postgatei]
MNETCDISFREKANIFSYEYLQCILFIIGLNDDSYLFTKKLCSKLIITSHIMEDFLDFHGAKKNKDWVFYRAISAAIRHLSLACYSQRHTLDRFDFYNFGEQNHSAFKQEALGMLKFLQDALHQAAPVALREAKRLGITIPESGYDLEYFPGIATAGQLEHNIDDAMPQRSQKKNLTRISSQFLELIRDFEQFTFYERYDLETIYKLVPDVINEVTMRSYEMRVHNIQSSFDSYVITTLQSPDTELLSQLRSHFSIVFHILQVLGRLLHFYERHLYDTGFKHVYRNIRLSLSDLIDPDAVLDRAMNYCLYYAGRFLSSGKAVATRVLNDNMESGTIEVGIPKDRGFHSRPSLLVAKIVQHYGGEVKLHVGKDQFDASSVLDIQWAGGKIKKEEIETVVFTGDSRALNDLKILSGVNYGEDHMGKGIPLPRELSYLI